jgi:hypothetical protein
MSGYPSQCRALRLLFCCVGHLLQRRYIAVEGSSLSVPDIPHPAFALVILNAIKPFLQFKALKAEMKYLANKEFTPQCYTQLIPVPQSNNAFCGTFTDHCGPTPDCVILSTFTQPCRVSFAQIFPYSSAIRPMVLRTERRKTRIQI